MPKGNQYLRAGLNAPSGVKSEVEKFRAMSDEERANTPLLYYILGDSTPAYKMSKKDSNYIDLSVVEGQNCGNCQFIYYKLANRKYICSQIAGEIKKEGWCRLWLAAIT